MPYQNVTLWHPIVALEKGSVIKTLKAGYNLSSTGNVEVPFHQVTVEATDFTIVAIAFFPFQPHSVQLLCDFWISMELG